MLTEEQIERYQRHIALKEVGGKGQQKLLDGRVLIIGAGGLGAPSIRELRDELGAMTTCDLVKR